MKFKISRSIKAGKLYYIARSLTGTIRRDTLGELEKAIEEYNERIAAGEIKMKVPKEEGLGSQGIGEPGVGESEVEEPKEVKIEEKLEEMKKASASKKATSKRRETTQKPPKKSPQRFSGYRGR